MFKAIKNFFKEIREEIKQEEEAKNALQKEQLNELLNLPISLERKALALSCPFRSVFVTGEQPQLFLHKLGILNDKQKAELSKFIKRDFGITDTESCNETLKTFAIIDEIWSLIDQLSERHQKLIQKKGETFSASIGLYILTSCADLEIISFEKYSEIAEKYIKIIKEKNQSWEQFAENFAKEDFINHALGKKLLKKEMNRLLNTENTNSPWQILLWEKL